MTTIRSFMTDDHRRCDDLFADTDQAVSKGNIELALAAFEHFRSAMLAHFDSEEAILRDCGMPAQTVLDHIRAHTEILDQYARLNLELMHGKAVSRDEALVMIREWIVEHVLNHDMKIAEYASAFASNPDPA